MLYSITGIAYNHHTDIYPLLPFKHTNIYTYLPPGDHEWEKLNGDEETDADGNLLLTHSHGYPVCMTPSMLLDELDLDVYSPGGYAGLVTPIVSVVSAGSAGSSSSIGDGTRTGLSSGGLDGAQSDDKWLWDWTRVDVMKI